VEAAKKKFKLDALLSSVVSVSVSVLVSVSVALRLAS
jgi:hypothetical protein